MAHQFDALVESALLSPRMGSVSPRPVSRADTWRARRGPELDEGTFVWESVEAVLHAHAQVRNREEKTKNLQLTRPSGIGIRRLSGARRNCAF